MPRAVGSRIFAAIWALWFVTALSEPAALHTCAMHGLGHGGHSARAQRGSTAGVHVGVHTPAPTGEPTPPPKHADCTCIGGCCVAIAAGVPGAPIVFIVSATPRSADVPPLAITAYRPTPPEYARPPSHAPPFLTA